MFNLNQASESVRKAAALAGVWSGKYEPIFDRQDNSHAAIVKVYNRNHPQGLEILQGEAENALNYTWREIKRNR
jgi:hypothetical protein